MVGLKRRLPRAAEVARFVGPTFRHGTTDQWSRVRTVADFKRRAQRRTPRSVFDYVEGAAELELSRDRVVDAFRQTVFHPHVLRDVSAVDTTTMILGRPVALPAVFGPTGFTRMMHAAGEPAVARAAGRAGIPYVLSTLGTTSPERLANAAPGTDRWFQLYVSKDRGASMTSAVKETTSSTTYNVTRYLFQAVGVQRSARFCAGTPRPTLGCIHSSPIDAGP